ncbi:MAG: zinc ribbon domain-containing protein [Elusimicrobia bacterium]|nr:zinc ribbon domain-containing protein [Elusimicrobiota bacterium]
MKCLNCGQENKDTAKACRKCSRDLTIPPAWFPDAQWHLRTLGIIYALVVVFYFGVSAALKTLPRPYNIRKIPIEMTPWLRKGEKFLPEDSLKAPPPAAEETGSPR